MNETDLLKLINLGLNIGVIPLIAIIWKLNNNISDLKTLLYQEFVTNHEFHRRLDEKADKRFK